MRSSSPPGPIAAPIMKLKMAKTMVTIRKFCAFVSHSMPTQQMRISTSSVTVPTMRISLMPLSKIFKSLFSANKANRLIIDFIILHYIFRYNSLSSTLSDSQKPMVFMDAETALANANTTPTDAPNSGPSEREMMKYTPPPFTSPLVLMADSESVVMTQTTAEMAIIINDHRMPDSATTQLRRKKSMTPQMLRRHGMSTPTIQPSLM